MTTTRTIVMVCLLIVPVCRAQTVDLSGTVFDHSTGTALGGVVLRVPSLNLSDTSASDGTYQLKSPATRLLMHPHAEVTYPLATIGPEGLTIADASAGHVVIRLFTVRGDLIAKLYDGPAIAGRNIRFPSSKLTTSVLLLHIASTTGTETRTLVSWHGRITAAGRLMSADVRQGLA
jgi:hypothetical protein